MRHLQTALANLADQVAQQNEQLSALDQHVSQLAKVLGQLGVELEGRLGPVERAIERGVVFPPKRRRS